MPFREMLFIGMHKRFPNRVYTRAHRLSSCLLSPIDDASNATTEPSGLCVPPPDLWAYETGAGDGGQLAWKMSRKPCAGHTRRVRRRRTQKTGLTYLIKGKLAKPPHLEKEGEEDNDNEVAH